MANNHMQYPRMDQGDPAGMQGQPGVNQYLAMQAQRSAPQPAGPQHAQPAGLQAQLPQAPQVQLPQQVQPQQAPPPQAQPPQIQPFSAGPSMPSANVQEPPQLFSMPETMPGEEAESQKMLDPKRALWAGVLMDIGNYVGAAGQRPMQGLGPKMMMQTTAYNREQSNFKETIRDRKEARELALKKTEEANKIREERRREDVMWRESQAEAMSSYRAEGRSVTAARAAAVEETARLASIKTQEDRDVLAQGIGEYEIKLPSTRSKEGRAVAARVVELYPDYDQSRYDQRLKTETLFGAGGPSSSPGNKTRALNASVMHMDQLEGIIGDLDNTNLQAVNRARNRYRQETGSTLPTNFETLKIVLADEIAAYFVPGVGSEQDRKKFADALDRSQSPTQLSGAIKTFKHAMAAQLKALAQQYDAGYGKGGTDAYYERFVNSFTLEALGLDQFGRPLPGNDPVVEETGGTGSGKPAPNDADVLRFDPATGEWS